MGVVVQLGVLAFLAKAASLPVPVATLIAVELAILHNFAWHQRWTWSNRPASGSRDVLSRLARFHALNGMVSLVGNLLLMRLFVGTFGMPAIPANLVAVLACALVNYFASDRFVFRPAPPGGYGEAPSAMSSCDSDVA